MDLTSAQWNIVRGFPLSLDVRERLKRHPVVALQGSPEDIELAQVLRAGELGWALHEVMLEENNVRENEFDARAQDRLLKAKQVLLELSDVAAVEFWIAFTSLGRRSYVDRIAQVKQLLADGALRRDAHNKVVCVRPISQRHRGNALRAGGPGR